MNGFLRSLQLVFTALVLAVTTACGDTINNYFYTVANDASTNDAGTNLDGGSLTFQDAQVGAGSLDATQTQDAGNSDLGAPQLDSGSIDATVIDTATQEDATPAMDAEATGTIRTELDADTVDAQEIAPDGGTSIADAATAIDAGNDCTADTTIFGDFNPVTQADFDRLAVARCIQGDLVLGSTPSPRVDASLLRFINGDFIIHQSSVSQLAIDSLERIEGVLEISESALEFFEPIQLVHVEDDIRVLDNLQLQEFRADSVQTAGESVYFTNNPNLISISIASLAIIPSYFQGFKLPALRELNLDGLTQAGGIYISECGLQRINGFSTLSSAYSINLSANPLLETIEGIGQFGTLNSLWISGNAQLQNLQGLESLSTVESIQIESNHSLGSMTGLEGVTEVSGALYLRSNQALSTLQGLEGLLVVGSIQIENNGNLRTLAGLSNLTRVNGNFGVNNNDVLTSLRELVSLIQVSYLFQVTNNPLLPTCDATWLYNRAGSTIPPVINRNNNSCP
ncbi:hypothetical protein HYV73_03165 [Candidatus Uhrbacteria bacterium]|nr:hypothetical protein [Candidatus Uhrbacteria bacterium]